MNVLIVSITALLLLYSTSVPAQVPETGRIGLWIDESRSSNEYWSSTPYTVVEMWIWCQPGENGMMCGEFAIQYPTNVLQSTITTSPNISVSLGDLPTGISFALIDCQTDWIWPFHQQLIFIDTTPSELSVVPHQGTGRLVFCNCLQGYPLEPATVISSLCYNQSCGPDLTPPSVDSLVTPYADEVIVYFDEPVSLGTAENVMNYDVFESADPLQQIPVTSATLLTGGNSVALSLESPMECGTSYTVSITGVEDISGNAIVTPVELTTFEPCPLIGLYADDKHLTSEIWEEPGVPIEMYIWCKPNRWGVSSAEFAVSYPSNINQGSVTTNPNVSSTLGELESGMSVSFSSCQTDWVWPFHQTLVRTNPDPALINVIPHPSLGGPHANECSGIQYQISLEIASPLYIGTYDPNDSIPPAIDSLVVTGYHEMAVYFNERLAPLTAENISNYSLFKGVSQPEEIAVTNALLLADDRSVLLSVDHEFLCYVTYTLYVSNVTDDSGNVIDPQTEATTTKRCTPPIVGCIGLYVDDHEVSEIWTDIVFQPFEMWIWCLPSENGMICAEFAIEYPANVIPATVTQNPEINVTLGDLPNGVSTCFASGNCKYDWTWLFHQTLYFVDLNPSQISIVEHPGPAKIQFYNCLPSNPFEDANVCSHLYYNQASTLDSIPPHIDSVAVQSSTELILYFNDQLLASTAEDASNYEILETEDPFNTITVLGAALSSGNAAVLLTLETPIQENANYIIRINNVEDDAGNVIEENSEVFLYPPVDLTASFTSAPPKINDCNDGFLVAFQLANSGGASADSFRVSIRVSSDDSITASDAIVCYKDHAGLSAESAIDDTLFVSISDIAYSEISYLGLAVDDIGQVIELIEHNNSAATPLAYNIPAIFLVTDYPDDQGRKVQITIRRSSLDTSESPVSITQYEIFRKIDQLLSESADDNETPSHPAPKYKTSTIDPPNRRYPLIEGWEYIGAVTANHDPEYIVTVPTLSDSTASRGMYWSTFFVRAATEVPTNYYDSCPDSGYSIDNIPPSAPGSFTVIYVEGSGNVLTWSLCTDEDFMYFRIYRGKSDDFIPFGGNLVRSTIDTTWTDPIPEGYRYQYKITTVDYAGNESDSRSSAIATDADVPSIPGSFALYQNVPNPFNPTTHISFDIPRRTWAKLVIYNINGRCLRILLDDIVDPGRKEIVWDGTDGFGRKVASGIYFYRLETANFTESKKMVLIR